MEIKRKPFQGVLNIIRFNWHFYLIAGIVLIGLMLSMNLLSKPFRNIILVGSIAAAFTIILSLLVSYFVYDLSDLYQLNWLGNCDSQKILNIHAGFDETSEIIRHKFKNSDIHNCDFYNPEKHTEISIKRARKAYPPDKASISVLSDHLPYPDNNFDKSLAILSAHEIRDENERIAFFREINRVTRSTGQIMVTEHLRGVNNFLAYTIGFFHFHSRKSWLKVFRLANLVVSKEIKITPFVTTFILEKNGSTL
jgi:hypothetical protein